MGIDLKSLSRALNASDKIVLPAVHKWLLQHGDDALPVAVAERIAELLSTPPRYRGQSFSTSSAGACERARIYAYLDAHGEVVDAQLANIFLDGKWRHLRWQAMMLAMGLAIDVEFPLPWPNKRSVGTMDALGIVPDSHPNTGWRGKEFGFELKGVSTFQFPKLRDQGPTDKHLDQVSGYFASGGFELFSIVYEDKTTQDIAEWVLTADNPEMKTRIKARHLELESLNKHVDDQTLPPRLPECQNLRGATYKACPYGGDRAGICAQVTRWPANGTLALER